MQKRIIYIKINPWRLARIAKERIINHQNLKFDLHLYKLLRFEPEGLKHHL